MPGVWGMLWEKFCFPCVCWRVHESTCTVLRQVGQPTSHEVVCAKLSYTSWASVRVTEEAGGGDLERSLAAERGEELQGGQVCACVCANVHILYKQALVWREVYGAGALPSAACPKDLSAGGGGSPGSSTRSRWRVRSFLCTLTLWDLTSSLKPINRLCTLTLWGPDLLPEAHQQRTLQST